MSNLLNVKSEREMIMNSASTTGFNTIILLTDFSDGARKAIKYAIDAFGDKVSYVLINTYYARTSSATLLDINDILSKESNQGLQKDLDWIRQSYPSLYLKIQMKSVFGTPVDAIKRMAKDKRNDLLVMGTTGATNSSSIFFGSVAERVIRTTVIPVLAIPKKSVYKGFNEIVLAADGKSSYTDVMLAPLTKFAKYFNSVIDVVSIKTDVNKADFSSIEKQLPGAKFSEIEGENIPLIVKGFCKSKRAKILTVLPRHTGFFERLFHHSVSKDLLMQADLPILALEKD
ncbi:MAG: universal stress protein [Crocinitomicaceae bacterium]